jgi:hypothetical protein
VRGRKPHPKKWTGKRVEKMVTHLAYCITTQMFGTETIINGTVCGLENKQSTDEGGNCTDIPAEVTCKKCLAIMANPKHWRYRKYIVPTYGSKEV